jgi:hypothetical protein
MPPQKGVKNDLFSAKMPPLRILNGVKIGLFSSFEQTSTQKGPPYMIKRQGGDIVWPEGINRAEATASSTAHLLSLSRMQDLLLLNVVLVNLEYVVHTNASM